MPKNTSSLLTALVLLLLSTITWAENSTHINGYTIHHNALKTDFLTPEIAASYGIQRSKYRGMLNVSVIREVAGTTGESVAADIKVKAINVTGLLKNIRLRKIQEGNAIYYIGDMPIIHREIVNFILSVTPAETEKALTAKFTHQFYVD